MLFIRDTDQIVAQRNLTREIAAAVHLLGGRGQRVDGEVSNDLALHLGPGAVRPLVLAVDGGGLRTGARPTGVQRSVRRSGFRNSERVRKRLTGSLTFDSSLKNCFKMR